ncbi:MAG: FtsX-like permease family protein, partial [Gemmatimonadales bacterium]
MSILARKLRRDLWHYRSQVAATVAMMAAGVALFVSMRSMRNFLIESQRDYYQAYRFADLFASVGRAPRSLARDLARIPGVAAVEPRIVTDAVIEVPGSVDLVTGRLVSIPDRPRPMLNDLFLVRGRYPAEDRAPGVVASQAFARAHRLDVGDTIRGLLNGRRQILVITALGLSPEFVYEIRGDGADFLPDARRFGVFWVPERLLGPAFDMVGSFNNVALALERGADRDRAIAAVDRILDRYGGRGAFGRDDQISNRFVTDEIAETQVTSVLIPTIFLGVTAFMLYLVTSRLIATEREQIALLKAFGFTRAAVVAHYAEFTLVIVAIGTVLGIGVGLWFASLLADVYAKFYQFPIAVFHPDPALIVVTLLIGASAAIAGGLAAVRTVLRLAPAEAMRPPAPPRFRSSWFERSRWFRGLTPPSRILVRHLIRRPVKAGATALGIAFGVAIVLVSLYSFDAIDLIKVVAFHQADRSDLRVSFTEPIPITTVRSLARVPGVLQVEPERVTAVRLRHGHRSKLVALTGIGADATLRRLVEPPSRVRAPPPDGIALTSLLADRLGLRRGDRVAVEALENPRRTTDLPVVATIDELLGFGAYVSPAVMARFLGEGSFATGARLAVVSDRQRAVEAALRDFPAVAGVGVR